MRVMLSPRPLRYLRWWRVAGRVWIVLALVLALAPAPEVIGRVAFGDKIGHCIAFALLAGWYVQLYSRARDRLCCVLGVIGLGALIEVLQALVPYRSADLLDLAADAAGTLLGWALAHGPFGDLFSWLERRVPRAAPQ